MAKYSVTPWRSQTDLVEIRGQLYPIETGGKSLQQHAVNRVMAWKLRGSLPHAVESTALLVDAVLHHDSAVNSTFSVRAAYSAAFCRFVTGFCDIGRHRERTLEPSSMLEIANQIGMPADFVSLRHEATHEELPSLQRLTTATQKALEWLWRVYWDRIPDDQDTEAFQTQRPRLHNEITAVLRRYRKETREGLLAKRYSNAEQSVHVQQTCEALSMLCPDRRQLSSTLAKKIVQNRLLFPADRDFNSSLSGSYLIWDGLILALQLRLGSEIVHEMALVLLQELERAPTRGPNTDPENEALAEWALHLIDFLDARSVNRAGHLAHEVMKECCLHPGFWTQRIARELLAIGNDAFRDRWSDLVGAVQAAKGDEAMVHASEEQMNARGDHHLGMTTADMGVDSTAKGLTDTWMRPVLSPSAPLGVVK